MAMLNNQMVHSRFLPKVGTWNHGDVDFRNRMVDLTIEMVGVQVLTIKVSHAKIGFEEGGDNTTTNP